MGANLLWLGLIVLAVLAFLALFRSSRSGPSGSAPLMDEDRLLREHADRELARRTREQEQAGQWDTLWGGDSQDQLLAAQGFDSMDGSN